MDNLNDYELIYLIRDNNQVALRLFFEKYNIIIQKCISKYHFNAEERADLAQEGLVILLRLLFLYDDSLDVPFSGYFVFVFNRHIKKNLAKKYTEIKKINSYIETYSSQLYLNDSVVMDNLVFDEMTKRTLSIVNKEMEKRIINEIILGNISFKEFSLKYNYNLKTVYNTYKKMVNRLRMVFKNDF